MDTDVHFLCENCGGDTLDVEEPRTPDSIVSCHDCKTVFGTWQAVQDEAVKVAGDAMIADIGSAFDRIK